ncbi:DUF2513 domain-containing protein [Pediococcus claussenii]|uniref:DUF2513 domain-containing protein n=1 Tax=Pediococcus claussenii TaxID=187452 RepID=UPI00081A2BD0|nr:DUF2513 domain-containing protein [Pediococcus claussenii]ANZ70343.1 hypothetical protein AYR57_08455 [Pediococcus claussenii]ANZ72159.1 hypothetical protein AYR58_08455 [Pediococcus claussenii]
MRLNQDCIRDVMIDVEEHSTWDAYPANMVMPTGLKTYSSYKKYGHDDFIYTLDKLCEAKLIQGAPQKGGDTITDFYVYGLTWEGHKFIDTIRDPKVWSNTKKVASHLESVSVSLLSSIGSNVINHMIDKSLSK